MTDVPHFYTYSLLLYTPSLYSFSLTHALSFSHSTRPKGERHNPRDANGQQHANRHTVPCRLSSRRLEQPIVEPVILLVGHDHAESSALLRGRPLRIERYERINDRA